MCLNQKPLELGSSGALSSSDVLCKSLMMFSSFLSSSKGFVLHRQHSFLLFYFLCSRSFSCPFYSFTHFLVPNFFLFFPLNTSITLLLQLCFIFLFMFLPALLFFSFVCLSALLYAHDLHTLAQQSYIKKPLIS